MKAFLLLLIATAFGCSSTVSKKLVGTNRQALPNGIKMFVFNEYDPEPADAEFIGDIKIGDSGFTTDCSYNTVLEHAKTAARKAGADVIKITEVLKPDFIESSCYRLRAKIYSSGNGESDANFLAKMNQQNASTLPKNADYASVYFYMPRNNGSLFHATQIDLKTKNDSIVSTLKIGGRIEYQTRNFGIQNFYVDSKTKPIIIDVAKGKEYFIRIGFTTNMMIGNPELTLVENRIGMKEYREMY